MVELEVIIEIEKGVPRWKALEMIQVMIDIKQEEKTVLERDLQLDKKIKRDLGIKYSDLERINTIINHLLNCEEELSTSINVQPC